MKELKVEDVMTNLVVKLYPNDTIHYAAKRLAQNDISGAPVVSEGKVVGIVSEGDLVRAVIPRSTIDQPSPIGILDILVRPHLVPADHSTVASVMSERVITIAPDAPVSEAAAKMERYGLKRLPVVDRDNNLLGIFSRADLVRVIADQNSPIPITALEA